MLLSSCVPEADLLPPGTLGELQIPCSRVPFALSSDQHAGEQPRGKGPLVILENQLTGKP